MVREEPRRRLDRRFRRYRCPVCRSVEGPELCIVGRDINNRRLFKAICSCGRSGSVKPLKGDAIHSWYQGAELFKVMVGRHVKKIRTRRVA